MLSLGLEVGTLAPFVGTKMGPKPFNKGETTPFRTRLGGYTVLIELNFLSSFLVGTIGAYCGTLVKLFP